MTSDKRRKPIFTDYHLGINHRAGILFCMARRSKDSTRAEIVAVLDTLERVYGKTPYSARFEPMDELVSCILSQHTSDTNSFPAFHRLRAAFPTWDKIVKAGAEEIEPVIRSAGLSNQKSKAIIKVLKEIKSRNGDYHIDNLKDMTVPVARAWLESLPSVGPKTSSIVLCFSFGKNAIPVDTHIFRVSKRLGFIGQMTDANKAHDELLKSVPEKDAFRYHVLLIQHGRKVCKARNPKCAECPVYANCRWEGKTLPIQIQDTLEGRR